MRELSCYFGLMGKSLMILMGKIIILVTHKGVVLVSWTHREVLDDSDPLAEGFSIYDSLKSWLMILTHERVSLVTFNPLGSVLGPSNPLGNVLRPSNPLGSIFRIFISFDLLRGIYIISVHLCNIMILHDLLGLSLNFFSCTSYLLKPIGDILIFFC